MINLFLLLALKFQLCVDSLWKRLQRKPTRSRTSATTRSGFCIWPWAPSKPYGLNQTVAEVEYKQSWFTCFYKSNINQTFTNGSGMILGVRIAIFAEIRDLVEELIAFLSIFGTQKFEILTVRLDTSLSKSLISIQ